MTTTDHVRIIAEAMGWAVDGGGVYKGDRLVLLTADDEDVFIFAAYAVAWAAGKGWEVRQTVDPTGGFVTIFDYIGGQPVEEGCEEISDPTDPHDTARATLAAIAEVCEMNEGGK